MKIQPIKSQYISHSTNHTTAFSVTRHAETGFKARAHSRTTTLASPSLRIRAMRDMVSFM
jgi:hypothetical protein